MQKNALLYLHANTGLGCVFACKYKLGKRICITICARTYAHAYTSDDAYAGTNADATATAATATLGSTPTPPDTRTHAHATANSCCPTVEPHPFRSKEHTTASGDAGQAHIGH